MIHRIIRTCFKISFKPIVLLVAESEWTKVTRNLQVTHVEAITTILVDSILVGISHNPTEPRQSIFNRHSVDKISRV